MTFNGIIIRKPKKSVFNPVPTYENQIINTNGALIEDKSGQSTVNVAHTRGNDIPFILCGRIDSNNRIHGMVPVQIDNNFLYMSIKSFFRIFENSQK